MKTARQNRMMVMLSDDEISVIDSFRYRYKIPTRAGAMRRLLYQGIRRVEQAEAEADAIAKAERAAQRRERKEQREAENRLIAEIEAMNPGSTTH